MTDKRSNKSDTEIGKELADLIDEINADMVKQSANRKQGDFIPTKQVFLGRGMSETEHKKWHERNRHIHMKIALRELYNNLNEGHELTSIDELKHSHPTPARRYPSIAWLELACHAAVWGVNELKQSTDVARSERSEQDHRSLLLLRPHDLSHKGKVLEFAEVAKIIATATNKPLPTAKESLRRLCSRRIREIANEGLELPQRLYKNNSVLPDLYIIRSKDNGGQYLFQRMKLQC